jgi:hypothetical protein
VYSMSQTDGKKEALKIAFEKLQDVDLCERSRLLSLGECVNQTLLFKAFGKEYIVHEKSFKVLLKEGNTEPAVDEKILIYHYLLSEIPYKKSDKTISFREFPGGKFYWNPFISRTVKPLAKRIGNNPDFLKMKLAQYDHEEIDSGDYAVRIRAIGNVSITLVYHRGTDEFDPEVDMLFDEYAKYVLRTDDAVAVASKICFGLF